MTEPDISPEDNDRDSISYIPPRVINPGETDLSRDDVWIVEIFLAHQEDFICSTNAETEREALSKAIAQACLAGRNPRTIYSYSAKRWED